MRLVAALLALVVCGCAGEPAAPSHRTDAASSAEEIAERLRPQVVKERGAPPLTVPLASSCWLKGAMGARVPPQGVPAYTAELRLPELDRPLAVRFWITSPERAGTLADATTRAARECAARPEAGDFGATSVDFAWGGWRGVQSLVTNPTSSDNGDPETTAALVAARGALLAEVSWSWSAEEGARTDRHLLRQGDLAAEAVLATVGGDPARPAS